MYRRELPSGVMDRMLAVVSTWPWDVRLSRGEAYLDHVPSEAGVSRHGSLAVYIVAHFQQS
jgi:hypothetical protein